MLKKLWIKWMCQFKGKYFYWNILKAPKNFYEFCKEVRHFLKYGYPYEAVYEMDGYFINLFSTILKDYKNKHWGCPNSCTNEEWEDIIQQMIDCLSHMNIFEVERRMIENCNNKMTTEMWEQCNRELNDNKNKFFELFSKWFYNLWD